MSYCRTLQEFNQCDIYKAVTSVSVLPTIEINNFPRTQIIDSLQQSLVCVILD